MGSARRRQQEVGRRKTASASGFVPFVPSEIRCCAFPDFTRCNAAPPTPAATQAIVAGHEHRQTPAPTRYALRKSWCGIGLLTCSPLTNLLFLSRLSDSRDSLAMLPPHPTEFEQLETTYACNEKRQRAQKLNAHGKRGSPETGTKATTTQHTRTHTHAHHTHTRTHTHTLTHTHTHSPHWQIPVDGSSLSFCPLAPCVDKFGETPTHDTLQIQIYTQLVKHVSLLYSCIHHMRIYRKRK